MRGLLQTMPSELLVVILSRQLELLNSVLLLLRRQTLRATLWGEVAKKFDLDAVLGSPSPALAGFTSLKLCLYGNHVAVNSSTHTCILLDHNSSPSSRSNTLMEITSLSSVQPYNSTYRIRVRVCRVWRAIRREAFTIVFWGKLAREFDVQAIIKLPPPVLDFPEHYPMEAPQEKFLSPAPQHPHIYSNGHICLGYGDSRQEALCYI